MAAGWRLVRQRYAENAFSGEGARRFGGRWNSPGTPIVYTSAHLSLAGLETLVHVQPLTPRDAFIVFRLEWEDRLMEILPESAWPPSWQAEPPGTSSMRIGDRWFREGRSAVLAVPSALIKEEKNYLLNPHHPDFRKVEITRIREFFFDPRLRT